MSDFALSALFLLLGALVALATAVIAARLAHQSWQNQDWERLREQRRTAALATVSDVSQLVDKRLYRQRKFLWALRSRDAEKIEAARADYASAVTEWMDNLGRIKAALWSEFDKYSMVRFEEGLHDEFARIGRSLEASYHASSTNLASEESDLNKLGRRAYEFSAMLLRQINEEDLAGLRDRWALTHTNWERLSSSYLLARLFGLTEKR